MKTRVNAEAVTTYREITDGHLGLNDKHPAAGLLQNFSTAAGYSGPTAVTRLEVYKECHRLSEDLYRLTGNKRVFNQVMRVGNLLLSRLFSDKGQSTQVNR